MPELDRGAREGEACASVASMPRWPDRPPVPDAAGRLLALQRSAGNCAVARLVTGRGMPNRTGIPDRLKNGLEALSGVDLSDVRVHRDSAEAAAVDADAYARGSEIHLGPGQERHLPHEAWHVVQQKQGRVPATRVVEGRPLNSDRALEAEASAMGERARTINAAEFGPALLDAPADVPLQRVLQSVAEFIEATTFRLRLITSRPTIGAIDIALGRYNTEADPVLALYELDRLRTAVDLYLNAKAQTDPDNPRIRVVASLKTSIAIERAQRFPDADAVLARMNDYRAAAAPAPTPAQIGRNYAAYLVGPGAPAAYAANLYTTFEARLQAGDFYNDITRTIGSVVDAYRAYVRAQVAAGNAAQLMDLATFATSVHSGQAPGGAGNQLQPVPNFPASSAQATARELALLGLPPTPFNFNAQTQQSIATIAGHVPTIQGLLAAGNPQTKLRNLLEYLSFNNTAAWLQVITGYNSLPTPIDILTRRLNPMRVASWEASFLASVNGSGQAAQYAQHMIAVQPANAAHPLPNLQRLRDGFFAHDGNAAPNLGPAGTVIGTVLVQNPAAIARALNHLSDLVHAWPHLNPLANPLPWGNRGDPGFTGLAGHFKKHVLGIKPTGFDAVESSTWLALLGLAPNGLLNRQSLGAMLPANEQNIFGASPAPPNATPATAAQVTALGTYLFPQGSAGPDVVAITAAHQALYGNRVVQQFAAAPPNRFIYHENTIKVNAHDNQIFMVAAYDPGQNRIDVSTGFIPAAGAAGQYNQVMQARILDV